MEHPDGWPFAVLFDAYERARIRLRAQEILDEVPSEDDEEYEELVEIGEQK